MGKVHAPGRKPKAGSSQRKRDKRSQGSPHRKGVTCPASGESEEKLVPAKSSTIDKVQILPPISTDKSTAATFSPINAGSVNNGTSDTVLSEPICNPCGQRVYETWLDTGKMGTPEHRAKVDTEVQRICTKNPFITRGEALSMLILSADSSARFVDSSGGGRRKKFLDRLQLKYGKRPEYPSAASAAKPESAGG